MDNKFYSCSFCNNDYTVEEGFNLETNQCLSCDTYDIEEPIKKAERDRQAKWWKEEGKFIEANLASIYGRRH